MMLIMLLCLYCQAPAFTEEVNAEEKEEEPPAEQAAVPEEPVDVPEDEKHDPHMHYAMLHPVYTRCAKKADMHSFVQLVVKSCGDIHELDTCSEPCAAAMRGYSERVGCCWETGNLLNVLLPDRQHVHRRTFAA